VLTQHVLLNVAMYHVDDVRSTLKERPYIGIWNKVQF